MANWNPNFRLLRSPLFFGHETALLSAFLCMNERYKRVASLSQLFHAGPSELKQVFQRMTPAEFNGGLMLKLGRYPGLLLLRISPVAIPPRPTASS